MFRDIPGLGEITALPSVRKDVRLFAVHTVSTDEDLLDLFAFHVSRDFIAIKETPAEAPADVPVVAVAAAEDPSAGASLAALPGFGFFDGSPGAPAAQAAAAAPEGKVPAKVPARPAGAAAAQPKLQPFGLPLVRLIN